MQKNFHIGKFLNAQGGGVYVWILLHARLELNAPSSYGLLYALFAVALFYWRVRSARICITAIRRRYFACKGA